MDKSGEGEGEGHVLPQFLFIFSLPSLTSTHIPMIAEGDQLFVPANVTVFEKRGKYFFASTCITIDLESRKHLCGSYT